MLKARGLPPSRWTRGGCRLEVAPTTQREQQGHVNRHVSLYNAPVAIYWLPLLSQPDFVSTHRRLPPAPGWGSSRHRCTKPLCKLLTAFARQHLQRLDRFLHPHANVQRGSQDPRPSHRHRFLVKPLGFLPALPFFRARRHRAFCFSAGPFEE